MGHNPLGRFQADYEFLSLLSFVVVEMGSRKDNAFERKSFKMSR